MSRPLSLGGDDDALDPDELGAKGRLPILQQFVILMIGTYGGVRWKLPVPAKYALVVVLSFLGVMIPYGLLIRRFNALRFLFGMLLERRTSD
jgi:hypothetical protein